MLKTENQVYLKLQPFVLELIEAGFIGGMRAGMSGRSHLVGEGTV
jgi:hypothetical protein